MEKIILTNIKGSAPMDGNFGDPMRRRNQNRPKLTVLLVDDIEENLELLNDVLIDQNFNVLSASSGADAMLLLDQHQVQLIVSDAMMPKMDGFQFCKLIKGNPHYFGIPFIIYTGDYVDPEDEVLGRSIGVDRYVIKYAGIDSLIDAISDVVVEYYGVEYSARQEKKEEIDEKVFLERHHGLVTKKLEEKMQELELYAGTLSKKNRELEISEGRYRTLFENASIAIFVIDGSMKKVLDVNKQGEVLLGYDSDDLADMNGLPFVRQDGSLPPILQEDEVVAHEAAMRAKSGEIITVEVSAAYVDQPNDSRIILFIHDITEKKKMREQMIQIEKMTLMGRLAAGIAHEIRNPLAGITLNLQYLQRRVIPTSPDYESVTAALEGAQRIQHVIEDTLGLARVTPPTLLEESINAIISRTMSFLTNALLQKNIVLDFKLQEDRPPVRIDFKQIQQVLLNVLQNAIDASPKDQTITITTRLFTGDESKSSGRIQKVDVLIEDRGPGLNPDVALHLFEPFRTTKVGGTGLGLALSKYIIDRHNGEIRLERGSSGGTLVRLTFPTSHLL